MFIGSVNMFTSGPNEHCLPGSKDYKPPRSVVQVLFDIDVAKGCGDLGT